jgi:hypothetical protein
VNVNGPALDEAIPTVVSELSEQGYETAAFLSVGFLGRVAGSFSHVDASARNAADTVAAASTWIERLPSDTKAFVWVHLYDIHSWYHGTRNVSQSLLSAVRASDESDEFGAYVAERHGWDGSSPVAGGRASLELAGLEPVGPREEAVSLPRAWEPDEARRNAWSQGTNDTPIPEEVEKELRALGYAR